MKYPIKIKRTGSFGNFYNIKFLFHLIVSPFIKIRWIKNFKQVTYFYIIKMNILQYL